MKTIRIQMKTSIQLVTIGLLLSLVISCKPNVKNTNRQEVEKYTDEIFDPLIRVRRDLHSHPELSGEEKRTSKIVADYLRELGLEVRTDIAGNSVIGILKGGKNGKKIAWRADMDAIRMEATDTMNLNSKNKGIAHMCGHDVHTTIGLGIAKVLSHQKEKLEGSVYFIFQASEETFTGAKDLIENGLLDIIEPEEIYGLHIGPAKKGTVSTKPKELFAYQKTIQIKLNNDSGKEEEIKRFLTSLLQGFVRNAPNSSPWSLNHLTDPEMGLENEKTIYKDYFILQNTEVKNTADLVLFKADLLETNKDHIDSILTRIQNKIFHSKWKDSFISIEFTAGNPTVYNDPELTKVALQTIESSYDKKLIQPIYGQIPYFNEDFIYYQQKVPGVLFLLGGSNMEKGLFSMPHSPEFDVDEETIKFGVTCFSSLILKRANSQ